MKKNMENKYKIKGVALECSNPKCGRLFGQKKKKQI